MSTVADHQGEDGRSLRSSRNKSRTKVSSFSSDEEIDDIVGNSPTEIKKDDDEEIDAPISVDVIGVVDAMTDNQLYDYLMKAEKKPGPVIPTTRIMYRKMAYKVMMHEPAYMKYVNVSSVSNGHENGSTNGNGRDGFSDSDDEDINTVESKSESASRSSRTSSRKISPKKRRGSGDVKDSDRVSTKPSESEHSENLRFSHIHDVSKKDQLLEKSFPKRRRETVAVMGGPYRRGTEVNSGDMETDMPENLSGPKTAIKKPQPSSNYPLILLALVLCGISVAVGYYFVINQGPVEEVDELDSLLQTME